MTYTVHVKVIACRDWHVLRKGLTAEEADAILVAAMEENRGLWVETDDEHHKYLIRTNAITQIERVPDGTVP